MATSSTTSFLSLPPEIRILIYEYLLVAPRDGSLRAIAHRPHPTVNTRGVPPLCGTPKPCLYCTVAVEHYVCWSENLSCLQHHPGRTLMARTGGRIYPAVLSVSKLTYKEAMPLLYFNLRLSFLITGHDDVHNILKSLPQFPCNVAHIHLNIHFEMTITASEREIIMDAIHILVFVLNQYEPAMLSGTVCPSPHNSQAKAQGMIHEIFRRCYLMPRKEPVAVMSDAKRAALDCRTTSRGKMAYEHERVNATLRLTASRQLNKSKDDLPSWLEESHDIRQHI